MNVLDVVQRACNAIGIPEPSTAVASTEDDVVQLVELLNQEGRSLSGRHDWQNLSFEATFTTVATESQGTLASIISGTQTLRKIVNDTIWNRTQQRPVSGPLSRPRRQAYKALSLTGPYSEYYIRGNTLYFYPAPTAGESCYFEYVSSAWCTDSTGATYRRNVAADSDEFLLDDEVILAGLEWRWLRKKGLSYAEEFASYEALVSQAISRDGTRRVLNMGEPNDRVRAGTFVPIGSWPL
jgi:hypothetical protein